MSRKLDELLEYINRNLKKGYNLEELRWALIQQGNLKMEVDKAIEIIKEKRIKEERARAIQKMKEEEPKVEIDVPVEEKKGFWSRWFGK